MTTARLLLPFFFVLACGAGHGQGTAPTFQYKTSNGVLTLPGQDPAHSATTVIPTVLVPVQLQFEAKRDAAKPFTLDAAGDVPRVLHSPIFSKVPFGTEAPTQYTDAMLR